MPPLTVPYRFKLEADRNYIVDESGETNNEANVASVMNIRRADS